MRGGGEGRIRYRTTASNMHIDGPDVVLTVEAGPILAMVFHVLAINAAQFGAIPVKSGCRCVGTLGAGLRKRGQHSMGGERRAQRGGSVELAHLPEGACCNLIYTFPQSGSALAFGRP